MGTPCPCQGVCPHSGAGALRGAHPQVSCPQDGVNPMKVTSSVGAAVSSQNKPTVESKGEGRWMAVLGETRICLHVHLILRVNGSNQVLTARNGNGGRLEARVAGDTAPGDRAGLGGRGLSLGDDPARLTVRKWG